MAVTKVIISESKQYKPVLVDSLVLDAAPTVGSLNGVTSDGVAKAISGSGSVPTPTADDDGKVLTANDGSFEWADPTGGASYSAGTGITISEENAIAVTEAISNGAAAGATAVQPADLNDYALSSSLATVATTGAYSDLSGTPTIPTVDQTYNASSTNAQSGVAVAEAIAAIPSPSVDEVPDVGSTDDGKVLTASYSGGVGSYSWETAQGGGGGGSSYTAGQGIAIDGNNAISVDASSSDFWFGQRSTLNKWSNNYNFAPAYYPASSVICTKDSYINMARETGNVHLVCDNTGIVAGNYAVCNANYAFSNWRLTSDVKIELSKTASDWTFTGNTFTLDNGLCYITIAGTTGSTVTPNGEIPVEVSVFDTAQFYVISNPNQLSLKNPIPTVDQSYNASSTHAQSGTAVAQALASAGGGITWSKISGSSITTTSSTLTANLSYSIPSGKTAVQVTIMLRCSNMSGSWSVPKQLSVKLKLTDDYESTYYYVGSIISADAWSSGSAPGVWMVAGTVVVPRDWFLSIDGIQLELPMSGGSLPSSYDKDLFVGIA